MQRALERTLNGLRRSRKGALNGNRLECWVSQRESENTVVSVSTVSLSLASLKRCLSVSIMPSGFMLVISSFFSSSRISFTAFTRLYCMWRRERERGNRRHRATNDMRQIQTRGGISTRQASKSAKPPGHPGIKLPSQRESKNLSLLDCCIYRVSPWV